MSLPAEKVHFNSALNKRRGSYRMRDFLSFGQITLSHNLLVEQRTGYLSLGGDKQKRPYIKPQIEFIKKCISKFVELSPGWDGYGGVPPTSEAINDALKLTELFNRSNCAPKRVGISGDGEISFFWKDENLFADFGVAGDGTYSYFINSNGTKQYGDDLDLSKPLSASVVNALKAEV